MIKINWNKQMSWKYNNYNKLNSGSLLSHLSENKKWWTNCYIIAKSFMKDGHHREQKDCIAAMV